MRAVWDQSRPREHVKSPAWVAPSSDLGTSLNYLHWSRTYRPREDVKSPAWVALGPDLGTSSNCPRRSRIRPDLSKLLKCCGCELSQGRKQDSPIVIPEDITVAQSRKRLLRPITIGLVWPAMT